MKHMKTTLLIILLLTLCAQALANPFPPNSPLGRGEHPRIWVTSDNIAEIRAKISQGGGLHADALTWRTWLDSNFNRSWYYKDRPNAMMHYAFAYLMIKDGPLPGLVFQRSANDYGQKAKDLFMAHFTEGYSEISAYSDETVFVTYDWVHPFFNQTERAYIINGLKPVDFITDESAFVTGNLGTRLIKLLSGIVSYGDGVDDAWALSKINSYGFMYRETTGGTRSESDLGGDDGGAGEGISYNFGWTIRRLLVAEEAYRTAMNIPKDIHYGGSDTRFFRTKAQHLAYLILPYADVKSHFPGGRHYLLEKGQYMPAPAGLYEVSPSFWLNSIIGIYQVTDPPVARLAQWLMEQRTGIMTSGEYTMLNNWIFAKFIMGPNTQPSPASPSQLGLPSTRYMQEGKLIIRNDWDRLDSSYITVHVNEWVRSPWGRSPYMPGAFQIHRKGPQVINQGGISGHDYMAAGGAGATNTMIFTDRSKTSRGQYDNMGHHRQGSARGSIDFVQNSPTDTRDEFRYSIADVPSGKDIDYVFVDITRSFSSTRYADSYNPARISSYTRQIVNFRPQNFGVDSDRMVIFDRATTTDTKYVKEWLFHTAGEPMVNGMESPGPARNGSTEGKWTYTGATEVTAVNTVGTSNGKTYLTPLYPENRKIVKVGGPNASGFSWRTDSHEYEDPYGVQQSYNIFPGTPERDQFIGRFRIEITPTTPSLYDSFLNVIEVGDSTAQKTPTRLVQGNNFIGARTGNRIAIFSRLETNLTNGDITIDQPGTYKILIADLHKYTEYKIQYSTTTITQTTAETATLYPTITTTQPNTLITITSTGTTTPPPTISFSTSHTSITRGQTATLSWTTTGAATTTINQGIGTTPTTGTTTVTPEATTTYTLTAINTAGTTTAATTIQVTTPTTNTTTPAPTNKTENTTKPPTNTSPTNNGNPNPANNTGPTTPNPANPTPTTNSGSGGSSGGGAIPTTTWTQTNTITPTTWNPPNTTNPTQNTTGQYVCTQDWQCSPWTECEQGLQTRQCKLTTITKYTQKNPCPNTNKPPTTVTTCQQKTETTKNQEEQINQDLKNTIKPAKYPTTHYTLLTIMAITIITGIIQILRHTKQNTLDDLPPPETVTNYIKNMRQQGRKDSEIKQQLAQAGWDKQHVKRYLKNK